MVASFRSAAWAAGLACAAWGAAASTEEGLLAEDSECGGDEQCSFHALQLRANAVVEAKDEEEVLGAAPDGADESDSDDSETVSVRRRRRRRRRSDTAQKAREAQQRREEAERQAQQAQQAQQPAAGTGSATAAAAGAAAGAAGAAAGATASATIMPLPANPPMPEPPTFKELNAIVIKGNFLYDSVTGKRFFAKGTSYNPRMEAYNPQGRSKGKPCQAGNAVKKGYTFDVISDVNEARWSEDLKAIANLGANTIRLFNIDAGQDHSKFMNAAAKLGIYVIIPLNSKDYGFLPAFPSPDCYTMNMTFEVFNADGSSRPYGNVGVNVLSYGKQIVKQFSKYANTLFFTVNNEFAMNDKNGFAGFQCVKALTRDIHLYQKSCSETMRRVPLIYSDYDMGAPDRGTVAKYLTCALETEDDAIDAYGLNVYSYCNNAYPGDGKADNFQYSPYVDIKKDFKDFAVPVLFTEFGCVEGDFLSFCPYKGGRTWPDVKLFFNEELGEILSGAIAYTYETDYEERGMVLTPGYLDNQPDLYFLDNYYALQKEFKSHDVSPLWDGADVTDCAWTPAKAHKMEETHKRPQCPSSAAANELQKKRQVSKVTDWHELPPIAIAPLADVGGQAECPADEVAKVLAVEGNCHFDKGA